MVEIVDQSLIDISRNIEHPPVIPLGVMFRDPGFKGFKTPAVEIKTFVSMSESAILFRNVGETDFEVIKDRECEYLRQRVSRLFYGNAILRIERAIVDVMRESPDKACEQLRSIVDDLKKAFVLVREDSKRVNVAEVAEMATDSDGPSQ